ncbi:MAG: hypothetical protein HRT89_07655 [Lentisphaeria bacterium]|nr:hypothetical protein [Lentisphaeria bacterium]NQZ67929.1 hypothetical protein [Lentisphaeria bacterium]
MKILFIILSLLLSINAVAKLKEPTTDDKKIKLIHRKMKEIIIPRVSFKDASLDSVTKFIRKRSKSRDFIDGNGINISLHKKLSGKDAPKVTFDFDNIPITNLIYYLSLSCNLSSTITPAGLVLKPREKGDAPIVLIGTNPLTIKKMKAIVIPTVDFEKASFSTVCRTIKERSSELDFIDGTGIYIVVIGKKVKPMTISLRYMNLISIFKEICKQAGKSYRVEDATVLIYDKESETSK